LHVVAAAEGKLVYLELKSSPPKHLSDAEVSAFFDRLRVVRPDTTLFVMDAPLRRDSWRWRRPHRRGDQARHVTW
jgi:hypothetical protein